MKIVHTDYGIFMEILVDGVSQKRKCEIQDDKIVPILKEQEHLLESIVDMEILTNNF